MKTARRTIQLLKQFSRREPELGVSELGRRLDMDRASVHRMLVSLLHEGVVQQNPTTKAYGLGSAMLEIASKRSGWQGMASAAARPLLAMRDRTGEGGALVRADGNDGVCFAAVPSRSKIRVVYEVGERLPLHCTACGLVLLAHMDPQARTAALDAPLEAFTSSTMTDRCEIEERCDQVRTSGHAYLSDAYVLGARAIAVPVRDTCGTHVAALVVASPTARLTERGLTNLLGDLEECSRSIHSALLAE